MQFRLVVEEGEQKGAVFPVGDGDTLIGRSHSADVRLRQPDVSARHVRIARFGSEIVVENLSRFGTLLDGEPLSEPVAMHPGQRLQLGDNTVIVMNTVPDDLPDFSDGTGAGTAGSETAPMDGEGNKRVTLGNETKGTREAKQMVVSRMAGLKTSDSVAPEPLVNGSEAAQPGLPETGGMAERGTSGAGERTAWGSDTYDSGDMPVDGTRELRTRVPAPDEMDFLKESLRKRARNRVLLIAGVVALLLAGLVIFWPRKEPPEDSIEWPRDADGMYLEEKKESTLGGFDLIYPDSHAKLTEMDDNRITVTCRVGRERDVPLTFVLEERIDPRLVAEDRATTIARWRNKAEESNGKCMFNDPLGMSLFVGNESGIPVVCIPYSRIENGSWCGTVRIIRTGNRLITLRTETPASERTRMDDLLYTFFLKPTTELVRRHWEGSSDIVAAPTRLLVDRAERELRRDAPSTWTDIQALLFDALRKATVENDVGLAERAMQLLVDLRERQALWFNAQSLARTRSLRVGDKSGAEAGAGCARAVFSSPDDRRYYVVRRW